jgi:prepilin peptidase CpaA
MAFNSLTTALIATLAAGALSDARTRRIPNVLTVSAFVAALALRSFLSSGALLGGFAGAGVVLLMVLPLFALRGIGGGDAKMLVAVGAFTGTTLLLPMLLATAIVGGVMSLATAARGGVLIPVLLNTRALLGNLLTLGQRGERTTLNTPGTMSVPYGVAIALGTLIALIWKGGLVP